jgi:hypothetical protein
MSLEFDQVMRRRASQSINFDTQRAGGFADVTQLESWAAPGSTRPAPVITTVRDLARWFRVTVPGLRRFGPCGMTTGRDVIRAALKNRDTRAGALSSLKDELRVPMDHIAKFIAGADSALSVAELGQTAAWLWGKAIEFDGEGNVLRPANRAEPAPLGIMPEPIARKPEAEIARVGQAPRPLVDMPLGRPTVARPRRPGWA